MGIVDLETLQHRRACHIILSLIVILALGFRLHGLSTNGFSEDEVAKLRAIEAYRSGHFSANGEHPMLMKLVMWGSLETAAVWNRQMPSRAVAPETALRLPNALAGALTVVAVYGVGVLLFGSAAGLLAAFIVAVDPTIISINRIGKEDTLLMLFFLLAVWSYEYAKRVGVGDPGRAQRWYIAAGGCFGLMLASKYMPHLFGLYGLFNVAAGKNPGANRPRRGAYHAVMAAAFLAANFALLMPATWSYAAAYLRGAHSTHHGYLYDGDLYVNSATIMVWGVPWTYYLRMIVTKVPLPVLAGMVAGVVLLFTRRNERGYVWLRVFIVIQLLGYAMFAAKFQRYALPLLIVLAFLAAAGLVAMAHWLQRLGGPERLRTPLTAGVATALAAALIAAPVRVAPHYSIYQNRIGAGQAPPATVYPEEAYDYGVREAVAAIAETAQPGAAIVSDAAKVVEHYVAQSSRRDLEVRALSEDGPGQRGEQWILVQDSHVYFENAMLLEQLRRSRRPWREYHLGGTPVLQVFKVTF